MKSVEFSPDLLKQLPWKQETEREIDLSSGWRKKKKKKKVQLKRLGLGFPV